MQFKIQRRFEKMSHEFEKGFSVREASWHGLAEVLEDYPGREEAMRVAGHDFNIIEAPMLADAWAWGSKAKFPVDGWKVLIRDDSKTAIGVVRDSYIVVPNNTMWDIVDALMKSDSAVKYETAGVLREGAVLWVLAKLDEPSMVKGDDSEIYPYVMVATTHDGTGACKAQVTSVRVICMNTYNMATSEKDRHGLAYKFIHTKNVMDRIEEAKEALGLVRQRHGEFMELANELADIKVNKTQITDFITQFIPDPPANVYTDRMKKNINTARETMFTIMQGETIPPQHKNTAYGLYCAGIEYLDHYRTSRSNETYFNRTVYQFQPLKPRLARLALKATA
jgi:phage/plasmid-like protein (TIGR03299 family)